MPSSRPAETMASSQPCDGGRSRGSRHHRKKAGGREQHRARRISHRPAHERRGEDRLAAALDEGGAGGAEHSRDQAVEAAKQQEEGPHAGGGFERPPPVGHHQAEQGHAEHWPQHVAQGDPQGAGGAPAQQEIVGEPGTERDARNPAPSPRQDGEHRKAGGGPQGGRQLEEDHHQPRQGDIAQRNEQIGSDGRCRHADASDVMADEAHPNPVPPGSRRAPKPGHTPACPSSLVHAGFLQEEISAPAGGARGSPRGRSLRRQRRPARRG